MFDSGPKRQMFERMMSDTPLLTSPQLDNWEIPANEVIMEKLLGEGAFGEVYKGVVKCPIVNPKVKLSAKNPICTPVAIKLLKCECLFIVYCLKHVMWMLLHMMHEFVRSVGQGK